MTSDSTGLWRHWIQTSTRRFGWAPLSVVTVHLLLSRTTRVYADYPWADMPMHFAGGAAIGYFFLSSTRSAEGRSVLGSLTPSGEVVLAGAFSTTSTVAWECVEWTTDRLDLTRAQAGLGDTMLDMVLGCLGAATVIALQLLRRRR